MIFGKLELYGAIALGTILALLGAYGLGHHRGYAAEHVIRVAFEAKTAAIGEQAKADALLKERAAKLNKEKADAENAKNHAGLLATIARLRNANPGSGVVPAAPASSRRTDLACFDRPSLERAYGELIEGTRRLADEGAACALDLDTAKNWAR